MEISDTQYRLKSLSYTLCIVMLFHKYMINETRSEIGSSYLSIKTEMPASLTFLEANDIYTQEIKSNDTEYNYISIKETIDIAINMLSDSVDIGGRQFLLEIAMIESRLGTDPNHVRYNGNSGRGVWQLDRIGFEETKNTSSHPSLKIYHKRLLEFGIDWEKVEWNDCNKPLYGAIAARLLILSKPFKISKYREVRAMQWKEHYNSHKGKGTPEKYTNIVDMFMNGFKSKIKKTTA
jgi:hypothetical protein